MLTKKKGQHLPKSESAKSERVCSFQVRFSCEYEPKDGTKGGARVDRGVKGPKRIPAK